MKRLVVLLAALARLTVSCPVCSTGDDGQAVSISNGETDNDGSKFDEIVMTRHVRRMQPDASGAITGPDRALEWGQLNFLHTTDTHGWLAGHVKQSNYGADWGDWISFVDRMRKKAEMIDVDLLLVDTGDLHDGNGLTDATTPNGGAALPVWQRLDYDVLTPGNHELYVADVTYYHFENFRRVYGDRYVSSNVQIKHPRTLEWADLGAKSRYFQSKRGINILAFGVIFDFDKASSASRVISAAEMVNQDWFIHELTVDRPLDLILLLGHNPVSPNTNSSTFETVISAIRAVNPTIPIQVFGGHQHVRDFAVYDRRSTGLASGKYCETIGWMALDNIVDPARFGDPADFGYLPPSRPAVPVKGVNATYYSHAIAPSDADPLYARRYLDWNRRTMQFHAKRPARRVRRSIDGHGLHFDTVAGLDASDDLHSLRMELNLTELYGCAPRSYCQSCAPLDSVGNIYSLVGDAMRTVVVNKDRIDVPRYMYVNTGSLRYDLAKGPFTKDDSFILGPFTNAWEYIPDVPIEYADQVLDLMNRGPKQRRSTVSSSAESAWFVANRDECMDPPMPVRIAGRDVRFRMPKVVRIQDTDPDVSDILTPGMTTSDDFGTDGDDTRHSTIPRYPLPQAVMANASFPTDGSSPTKVDLIFVAFVRPFLLRALGLAGSSVYSDQDVKVYNDTITSNTYLPLYVRQNADWQANMPDCPTEGDDEW